MKLIFNADDFGMTKGAVYGTLDAYKNGVVRSTTMLANGHAFDLAVQMAKENPGLDIGVHLALTFGSPVLKDLKTLVNYEGKFYRNIGELTQNAPDFSLEEVEREFTAQIEKIKAAGIPFTHFDVHHLLEPHIYEVEHRLAEKYGVSVRRSLPDVDYKRLKTPDLFLNDFYGEGVTMTTIRKIVEAYKHTDQVVEIMTHPAFMDEELLGLSSYSDIRMKEVTLLTSKELQNYLAQENVTLASFRDL
ncbi:MULTISPECIES: chitin disaccharide deacetylase [Listeria]|uniref:chitin disaccharide deacetylase n=1 Tax=Listeria TaxID=1637 RepID=UPI000B58AFF6|nr:MULTISPECIES: chitin disaccharide deacetylase [Listeria]